MMLWDVSWDGTPWKVKLDVRDLGRHLDFTRRAWAGTLSGRVREATRGVAAVGALPLGQDHTRQMQKTDFWNAAMGSHFLPHAESLFERIAKS